MNSSNPPATIRPTGRVLACARDAASREHLVLAIRRHGYEADAVDSLDMAEQAMLSDWYAAIVIDEPDSPMAIEDLERRVRKAGKPTQFVILPSLGQRSFALRSISCDIVDPPLTPERIARALFSAVGRAQLISENLQLKQRLEGRLFDGLVGVSEATRDLRQLIQEVAEHDRPVLVYGEPGSGKSEVARAIHLTRSGPGKPLLTTRCSLLTAAAVERELFGDSEAPGRLVTAASGTLVFEDIEALSQNLQDELATILERGSVIHNGEEHRLESRIIATTSADLERLARTNRFSTKLLDQLSNCIVAVAPLRERLDDLPVLAEHFLQQCAVREGQPVRCLTPGALDRLHAYAWPGNVRELENVIARCCSLAAGDAITADEVGSWLEQSDEDNEEPGLTLREMERKLIEATFNRFGGNRELTAKALKIGIRTLSGKLREYGYPPRGGPGSNKQRVA